MTPAETINLPLHSWCASTERATLAAKQCMVLTACDPVGQCTPVQCNYGHPLLHTIRCCFHTAEYALAGLFGAVPSHAIDAAGDPLLIHGSDSPQTWNEMERVFPTEGFAALFEEYQSSYEAGGPHVFSATYQVCKDRAAVCSSPDAASSGCTTVLPRRFTKLSVNR